MTIDILAGQGHFLRSGLTHQHAISGLGFDAHGRLLELAILTFDSGDRLVIHAMKARPHFTQLLE